MAGEFQLMASFRSFLRSLWLAKRSGASQQAVRACHFLERMEKGMAAFHGPMLLLISERDLTAKEFEALCRESPSWGRNVIRKNVQRVTIAGADHTFSSAASLGTASSKILDWLRENVHR